jgi:hypothetical protein
MLPRPFSPENSNPLTANPVSLHRAFAFRQVGDGMTLDGHTSRIIIILGHVTKYSLWDGPNIQCFDVFCWSGELITSGIVFGHATLRPGAPSLGDVTRLMSKGVTVVLPDTVRSI